MPNGVICDTRNLDAKGYGFIKPEAGKTCAWGIKGHILRLLYSSVNLHSTKRYGNALDHTHPANAQTLSLSLSLCVCVYVPHARAHSTHTSHKHTMFMPTSSSPYTEMITSDPPPVLYRTVSRTHVLKKGQLAMQVGTTCTFT